jgi:ribosomal protein S18 acetylase RimI-like enzyme
MAEPAPDPLIRPARPEDVPAAARLAAQLVRRHHALDSRRFAILADPVEPGYERFLRERLGDPRAVVLVAAQAAEVVGYAYGQLEPRDWMRLLEAGGRVHDLIVMERARGRGLGSALLMELLRRLERLGAAQFVLDTAAANPAAQRFFERHGFRRTMIEYARQP